MKFISIRDFRSKSGQISRRLPREKEMVLTSNGKPIAVLSAVTENDLEEQLSAIRCARAISAVNSIQEQSEKEDRSSLSLDEINAEISRVRRARHSK